MHVRIRSESCSRECKLRHQHSSAHDAKRSLYSPKIKSPITVRKAPGMAGGNLASGGALPSFLAASLSYSLLQNGIVTSAQSMPTKMPRKD